MDIVLNRRSVRKFDLNKMIPHEDLVDLIKHGEAAGTARRQKSREYIFIENKDVINELAKIYELTAKVNKELKAMFAEIGVNLIDFKVEFGRTADGEIVLADEISPDCCRLWDAKTNDHLDKDRFRRDLGDVMGAYVEILKRLETLK